MLKIFVTGDNHFGKRYANHPAKDRIIEERFKAFERAVAAANEARCGLFAVTGDLFDECSVPKKTIKRAVEILSGFDGDVVVLPGNHDPYTEDSKLWQQFKEESAKCGKITLLCEYRPYAFDIGGDEAVIYPAFCDERHSENSNRLDWIKDAPIQGGETYHIGMAHGAVLGESLDSEGQYFPMSRGELYAIPVDAWLIGHTHVPFPRDLSEELMPTKERVFNPGTHSQTDVSNNTEGDCFIIEIDGGKNIKAKKVTTGKMRFYRREVFVSAGSFKEDLVRTVEGFSDDSIVELRIKGAVNGDEYDNRRQIIDEVKARFIEANFSDSGLSKLITREIVKREFPETSFCSRFLTELLADPKEAHMAYELLREVKEGGK